MNASTQHHADADAARATIRAQNTREARYALARDALADATPEDMEAIILDARVSPAQETTLRGIFWEGYSEDKLARLTAHLEDRGWDSGIADTGGGMNAVRVDFDDVDTCLMITDEDQYVVGLYTGEDYLNPGEATEMVYVPFADLDKVETAIRDLAVKAKVPGGKIPAPPCPHDQLEIFVHDESAEVTGTETHYCWNCDRPVTITDPRDRIVGVKSLETKAEAEAWIRDVVAYIGGGYHPDTRFDDYIVYKDGQATGERTFTDAEASRCDTLADMAEQQIGDVAEFVVNNVEDFKADPDNDIDDGLVDPAEARGQYLDDYDETAWWSGHREACPRCKSEDVGTFGATVERTDANVADHAECNACGWTSDAPNSDLDCMVCVAGGCLIPTDDSLNMEAAINRARSILATGTDEPVQIIVTRKDREPRTIRTKRHFSVTVGRDPGLDVRVLEGAELEVIHDCGGGRYRVAVPNPRGDAILTYVHEGREV